jgi:hypothetical protein
MHPFALPKTLPPALARTQAYWQGLLRGGADMPFWDDLVLENLGDLRADAFTLDVFENPLRFRVGILGEGLKQRCGEAEGQFLDEVTLAEPLDFLMAQAAATVESRGPTVHKTDGKSGEWRLLLPMWGEGRVGLLLGVVGTP